MYEWYQTLKSPAFAPPGQIFTPVWVLLYCMIFSSLLLFASSKRTGKTVGYVFFAVQMVLNLLWSPVFFLFRNIAAALVVVILLDVFVLLTIKEFYPKSKTAAFLLLPYFVWILFATYLNFGYLILNK